VWARLCALAGAFCYSELGVNFPSSGASMFISRRPTDPLGAFMTGWISFFAGFSAPIAAAALAFSDYLGHFFGALKLGTTRMGAPQILASAIIAALTFINCLGITPHGRGFKMY